MYGFGGAKTARQPQNTAIDADCIEVGFRCKPWQTMCHCQKANQYIVNVRLKLNSSLNEIEKKINIGDRASAAHPLSQAFRTVTPAKKGAQHLATHTHSRTHAHNYVVLLSSKSSCTRLHTHCTIKRTRFGFSLSRTPGQAQSALRQRPPPPFPLGCPIPRGSPPDGD